MPVGNATLGVYEMNLESSTQVGLRGHRVMDAERRAEQRRAIIRAAARVFTRESYYTATMDDIAQELGVSKGVLYYQFRSKEDVFREILVIAISEALRRLVATNARGGSAAGRLREGMRELIAYNLDEDTPNYSAMMVIGSARALSGENRERVRDLQRQYQNFVAEIIREGVRDGEFAAPNAHVAAMNILAGANGVSNWFVAGRAVDAAGVADQVSEQLVRGILANC